MDEDIPAHPLDQDWFWTKEWQAGEREVDAQIAAGLSSGPFTADELVAYLEGLSEEEDEDGPVPGASQLIELGPNRRATVRLGRHSRYLATEEPDGTQIWRPVEEEASAGE